MRKIIVHGGAGSVSPEMQRAREPVLEEAARAGLEALVAGPERAVEAAINILEDSELFNAGYGGAIQLDGEVRLDASIMNSALECGGVISLPGIKRAISVALLVMQESPHVLLSGEGALRFAEEFGFAPEELRSPRALAKLRELQEELAGLSYREQLARLRQQLRFQPTGTVGAVALLDGRLAAGTSTGGRYTMLPGRVGDTPLIGAGTYCNEFGGASATGAGEDIIRVCLAREVVRYIEEGAHPQEAAERGIALLARRTNSSAGVIALDRFGNHGAAFNTEQMGWAVCESR
ncbi:MAG: isoaspartyl peptidase/L-asparaginase [Candidatus Acetothermia bacterium]|nr:isoaspartyl peptidase/L-asparaginase [Candidatus Acetothermia bacterium]MDH7505326.1 isoaspartyl peptidase/L-asparaginase [Candidatus Acetothermia bacterium]